MRMFNPPHPGEILRESYFEPLNLTVTEASERLNIARNNLSKILNGKANISTEMSQKLAIAFDTTPELWLNMQQQYDLWQFETDKDNRKMLRGIKRFKRMDDSRSARV